MGSCPPQSLLNFRAALFNYWMAFSKTFTKWAYYFVERISELKDDVIKLEERFEGYNDGVADTNCFISVDGTNCPVFEPYPFSKSIYLHKLNGP